MRMESRHFPIFLLFAIFCISPSQSQEAKVPELRTAIEDASISGAVNTSESLYRYLKASNSGVKLAATKLRRTSQWRRINNIDEIGSWEPPALFNESLPYAFTGYSAEGNPVVYYPLGLWSLRQIRREGKASDVSTYVNQLLEKALKATTEAINPKTGEPVKQAIFIVDLQGFNFRTFLTEYGASLFTYTRLHLLHDDHYPLLVKKWYVIRTPKTFRTFWGIFRNLISRENRKTVEVYTRYSQRWRTVLFKNLPKNAIPVNLGGEAVTNIRRAI